MSKVIKCPVCNHILSGQYVDWRKSIKEMVDSRPRAVQIKLREAFLLINEHIPSEKENIIWKYYKFLKRCEKADAETLLRMIRLYIDGAYYLKMAGYDYLSGMVMNEIKNYDRKREIELKIIGKIPKAKPLTMEDIK